jgi:PhoPQ-activated pathogenicity-related protein
MSPRTSVRVRPATAAWAGVLATIVMIACRPAAADTAAGALAAYVAKPDVSYGWEIERHYRDPHADVVELRLRSQTWQGVLWQHQMLLIRPKRMADPQHALLIIGGGRWHGDAAEEDTSESEDMALPAGGELFVAMARALRSPVVVVAQVPFQPLFDLSEDHLIAYTFDKYLKTGDAEWPLLLPMVKSAVRALDASSAASVELWGDPLTRFTVLGGSKRGWTTWLTAAVEPRVTALAPIVIDALNMERHFPHQTEVFGAPSDEIQPYTDLDLPNVLASSAGAPLREIVDPYSYRDVLRQPKLVMLATNDRYFPVDSANLYWDGLVGPKYLLYLPNEPHSIKHYGPVIRALRALHAATDDGAPLPNASWEFQWSNDGVALCVSSAPDFRRAQLWRADSPVRDFRAAAWSVAAETDRSAARFEVAAPAAGYAAVFAELDFGRGLKAYSLSTNLAVFPAAGEPALTARPNGQPGVCAERGMRTVPIG